MENAKRKTVIFLSAVSVIAAILFCSALLSEKDVAYADSQAVFQTLFPTESYFQSLSPAFIGANEDYLIVYDDEKNTLFSRKSDESAASVYVLSLSKITDIYAVGAKAFINTADGLYSIALGSSDSLPVKTQIPSPNGADTFFSDGNRLYAKSISGQVSVYDENLNSVYSDVQIDELIGKPVVTAQGNSIYAFTYADGRLSYFTYDFETGRSDSFETLLIAQSARAGDCVFASVNNGDKAYLIALNKNDGTVLFETKITPVAYKAYRDKLYTVNLKGQIVIYRINSASDGLDVLEIVSMSGGDEKHLDSPADVCAFNGVTAAADSGNDRIALIDKDGNARFIELGSSPIRLSADGNDLIAATDDGKVLFINENGSVGSSYSFENEIFDIAYLDKLFVLSSDGLYVLVGGNFVKISDTSAKRMTVAQEGNYVYLLENEKIAMLDRNGEYLHSALKGNFSAATDISVSYTGDVFLLFGNRIEQYSNFISSMVIKDTYSLINPAVKATPTSLYVYDSDVYFSAEECFIGKLAVNAVKKSEYTPVALPSLAGDENYSFFKVKDGVFPICFSDGGRADCAFGFKDSAAIVLDSESAPAGKLYAVTKGKVVLISADDFEPVSPSPITADYLTAQKTTLYLFPDCEIGAVNCEKDIRLTALDDACGYHGFIRVKADEKTYFVKTSDIKTIENAENENKTYGKAKASRIGGKVNIYAAPDTASEVVASVVDGKKLEILDTLDGYYKIRIGDITGYIEADKLLLRGLTGAQIVAIIVTILVFLAGLAVFVTVYRMKKRSEP